MSSEKYLKRNLKLKIYLDTSVISHLDAPHKPFEEGATWAFYRFLDSYPKEIGLCISPVTVLELEACPDPKKSKLFAFLSEHDIDILSENSKADFLVDRYLENHVLGTSHYRDLTHFAYAVVAECDFILSWNFRHFVNPRTVERVCTVNRAHGYQAVTIISPITLQEILTNEYLRHQFE